MFFTYATILSTRAINILCFVIPQSLEANWRRGHYTVTRVQTGSGVRCLQFDDIKIVTGLADRTIKVGSCYITCVS